MSPKIGTVQGAAIRVIWWEIQLKIETNPCSPRIGTVRETASNFEGVFRHFVMNLSDCFWLQATVYVHGRDNQSFPPSLVHKEWLNLALTFSAAALRGSPHSSHHQKQIQISLMVRRAGLSRLEGLLLLLQQGSVDVTGLVSNQMWHHSKPIIGDATQDDAVRPKSVFHKSRRHAALLRLTVSNVTELGILEKQV